MKPAAPPALAFAPATHQDFDALATLRVAAMRESLERAGRFDPQRARDRLRQGFDPAHTWHIVLQGRRVGFFVLRPALQHLLLAHLYIHPDAQGAGLGAHVLAHVFAQADASGLPVHVGALKGSASNRFYLRHGFVQTGHDEFDNHYVRPATSPGRHG